MKKVKRAAVLALVLAFMFCASGCNITDYHRAGKFMDGGYYAAAGEMYKALGDYKDSTERADECSYRLAKAAFDDGDFERAAGIFTGLGGFGDSAELARACTYELAKNAYEHRDYETASGLFDELGDYEDSLSLRRECEDFLLKAALIGKWTSEDVPFADLISSTFGEDYADDALMEYYSFDDAVLAFCAEFTDSGTFILDMDAEAVADSLYPSFAEGFRESTLAALEESFASNGISNEALIEYYGTSDLEEIYFIESGMTIDEMRDSFFSRDDFAAALGMFCFKGDYEVKDGKVSISYGGETETLSYSPEAASFALETLWTEGGILGFTRSGG